MAPGIPKKTNTKNGNVIANSSSSSINNAIRKIRDEIKKNSEYVGCLLYTSPSPRDLSTSRMPSSA